MKAATTFFSLLIVLIFSGCAVGNKYDYQLTKLPLPISGEIPIGLTVRDQRPYVLDGDKPPTFVGLQRGGFGNPFNVTTLSGAPMVDDMERSIIVGLESRGFSVESIELASADPNDLQIVAEKEGVVRILILDVFEWKSDIYSRLTLHYNLRLSVYDPEGQLLGESSIDDVKVAGAMIGSKNSLTVQSEFERLIGQLFRSPEISQAF